MCACRIFGKQKLAHNTTRKGVATPLMFAADIRYAEHIGRRLPPSAHVQCRQQAGPPTLATVARRLSVVEHTDMLLPMFIKWVFESSVVTEVCVCVFVSVFCSCLGSVHKLKCDVLPYPKCVFTPNTLTPSISLYIKFSFNQLTGTSVRRVYVSVCLLSSGVCV